MPAVLKMRNKYCSNCLCTRRFLDLGNYLVCERCNKRLHRVEPVPSRTTVETVPWAVRPERRRDAM